MVSLKKILEKRLPRSAYHFLSSIVLYYKTVKYRKYIMKIEQDISQKERIKVVFLVVDVSMWKYDSLFKLMLSHPRFEPVIVSYIVKWEKKIDVVNQKNIVEYFKNKKKYPFIEGYNIDSNQWFDIKREIQPDIIFYAQPYRLPYSGYEVSNFYKKTLIVYSPYGPGIENKVWEYNSVTQNAAWRLFYATDFHLKNAQRMSFIRGKNVVITGDLMLDVFKDDKRVVSDPWKISNSCIKRIIWAPHHSILKNDTLNYSNFLRICDDMLILASKYRETVQFAFKPHPSLKPKLYSLSEWGIEKTNAYYQKWENLPNSVLIEGDYVDLFLTSDALIHDCSSFSVEYLYTQKPVMYITKEDHLDHLCDFGRLCFNMHYKGYTREDIDSFIENIILKENDYKKPQRGEFFNQYLLPPHGKKASENILDEILRALS